MFIRKALQVLVCLPLVLVIATSAGHQIDTVKAADCSGLQAAIDGTPESGTLTLPAGCVYRESAVITKPITIIGGEGVQIRGSDIWTDWMQREDGRWASSLTLPDYGPANLQCDPSAGDRCLWKEQVFVDDAPLTQIAQGKKPAANQFALDSERHVILFDNPNGHTIEVTTRKFWLNGPADNVTIDNIIFRHASNDRGAGALDAGGDNWTVENSSLGYAHAADIAISQVTGTHLLNNEIFGAGQAGVVGNNGSFVIEGGRVHDNNIEGTKPSWAGGGIKISNPRDIVITGVEVDHNHDNGIWTDVPNTPQSVVISNNRVHHNPGDGIRVEVTTNANVFGNIVYENGWDRKKTGIALNASSDANVHDNVLAWNYSGIQVRNPIRTDKHSDEGAYDFVNNINVHHNTILDQELAGKSGRYALSWVKAYDQGNLYDQGAGNIGHQNGYYYPSPEGTADRFFWENPFSTLSEFNNTPGEKKGYYLTEQQKDEIIARYLLPAQPEPH
ncbi:MAG: hypothetical protein K0R75_1505 [Paenibacillaceae bacterium]|nr:hypothetical protein [Paenibacillaceae bacterium]